MKHCIMWLGDDDEAKYLIATSEQPMSGFHANEWFAEPSELPKKYIFAY